MRRAFLIDDGHDNYTVISANNNGQARWYATARLLLARSSTTRLSSLDAWADTVPMLTVAPLSEFNLIGQIDGRHRPYRLHHAGEDFVYIGLSPQSAIRAAEVSSGVKWKTNESAVGRYHLADVWARKQSFPYKKRYKISEVEVSDKIPCQICKQPLSLSEFTKHNRLVCRKCLGKKWRAVYKKKKEISKFKTQKTKTPKRSCIVCGGALGANLRRCNRCVSQMGEGF